jgi:hypothetical protein
MTDVEIILPPPEYKEIVARRRSNESFDIYLSGGWSVGRG